MEDNRKLDITMASWVRGATVVVIFLVLFLVRDILLALLTSIVIASAIEPATLWAKRRGIPRLPSVITVYVLLLLFLSGVFYFLFLPLIAEVSAFLKTLTVYTNASVNGGLLSDMFQDQGVFTRFENSLISMNELGNHIGSLATFLSQGLFSSVSLVFGGLISFLLIVVLSFYLAVQEDGVGKFIRVITPYKQEKYMIGLWKRSQHKIGLWMQGQLMLSTIVGVITYLGLTLLGIEHALLLAVLAGLFELIPLFGPILAAIPAMFVAFVGGGMPSLLIVGGFYLIVQQLENHVIHPLIVRKVVGIPPIISIIALILGGKLAGFLGIVIAVPMAAIVIELLSDFEEHKNAKTAAREKVS